MGQKINPVSNRLGIIKGWDSNWFGGKTMAILFWRIPKSESIFRPVWLRLVFLESLLNVLLSLSLSLFVLHAPVLLSVRVVRKLTN